MGNVKEHDHPWLLWLILTTLALTLAINHDFERRVKRLESMCQSTETTP